MKKICSALLWIGCLAVMASGQVSRETNQVTGQATGSVLLFEHYSSHAARLAASDTHLRVANRHASEAVIVRVLFCIPSATGREIN